MILFFMKALWTLEKRSFMRDTSLREIILAMISVHQLKRVDYQPLEDKMGNKLFTWDGKNINVDLCEPLLNLSSPRKWSFTSHHSVFRWVASET
jgi:hypothetical protein